MKKLWKIACQEDIYPGMWQHWYKNQCVAVGWAAKWGFKLVGESAGHGWSTARNALNEMNVGDYVVVALRDHRVGRIGEITGKAIGDDEWNPLVPPGPGVEDGEMGRRVLVRWDLTVGPDSQDLIVQLPAGSTFSNGELRHTVSRISSISYERLVEEMNDSTNWVSLLGGFRYEKALSDFIANYPNHLEDGLLPHPNSKIRERIFNDGTRLDVLLIDRLKKPVIVECKRHAPSTRDIEQLRNYMKNMEKETGELPRGILVHGGALKLEAAILAEARREPAVEVVGYTLDVTFKPSVIYT